MYVLRLDEGPLLPSEIIMVLRHSSFISTIFWRDCRLIDQVQFLLRYSQKFLLDHKVKVLGVKTSKGAWDKD